MLLGITILGLTAVVIARIDRVESRQAIGTAVVNDGDTITLGSERIRLRGIDAPELDQTCRRGQASYACGRDAKSALRAIIAGRSVICEGWERDRYGRLLAACSSGGIELNRRLVADGWAVAFGDFEIEERGARDASRGLWAGEFDRPRQWRDTHGSLAEADHDAFATIGNWIRAIFGLG